MDTAPTPSQTIGPFFHVNLTTVENCVRCIAGPRAKGERVWMSCRLLDGAGEPVPDAMIELWQADAEGRYHSASPVHDSAVLKNEDDPGWRGFGRMPTDENGSCEFETIRPGRVPSPGGVLQAPHLEVAIFARGMLKQLFTRVYFAGDQANREDPVLKLAPEDRRETLMAFPDAVLAGKWLFDIHLQGEEETVFFDV